MIKHTILLIEDNGGITSALSHALGSSYDIDVVATGHLGLNKLRFSNYDLIILDLNLPDLPGDKVCQEIRDRGNNAPILILSGETKVHTKVNLLDIGANDYLTKPFSLGELNARLRALLRTAPTDYWKSSELDISGVHLNRRSYEVYRDKTLIRLRRKEFFILNCLMDNAGFVVTRDQLIDLIWKDSEILWTNTIDVHIKHIRDKLDKPFKDPLIHTVHGLGYRFGLSNGSK